MRNTVNAFGGRNTLIGNYPSRRAAVKAAQEHPATAPTQSFTIVGYSDGSWDWSTRGKSCRMPEMEDAQYSYRMARASGRWYAIN